MINNPNTRLASLGCHAMLALWACLPASAGLKASYFSGRNFEVPVLERIEDRLEQNWGDQSPAPAVPVNDFSARWQGFVTAEFSGEYRLHVVSDNGSRLKLNGQVITDYFNPAEGVEAGWFSGKYTFTAGQKVALEVEYYESNGNAEITLYWESNDQLLQVIPTQALTLPDTPTPTPDPVGWTARYFDGRQFEKTALTRIEPGVDFEWSGAPVPELFADNFSAKWSGLLTPPETGTYTFTVAADNGTRLWINGELVSGAWDVVAGEDGGWRSIEVPLTAGQPVPILLDYYQAYGSASIALFWTGPGQPWEVVPGSRISALPLNTPPWIAALPDAKTPAGTPIHLPIQASDANGATLTCSAQGLPLGVSLVTQTWPGLNPRDLPPVQTVSLSGTPWQPGRYQVIVSAMSPAGTSFTRFWWEVTGPATDPGIDAAIALVQSSLTLVRQDNPDRMTLTCVLPSGITQFYDPELERTTNLTDWTNRTAAASFYPASSLLIPATLLYYEEALGSGERFFYRIRLNRAAAPREADAFIRR